LLEYSNQLEINPRDDVGNTPLHLACEDQHVEVAKLLVEAGGDCGAQNKEEKTPLEMAKREVNKQNVKNKNNSDFFQVVRALSEFMT